MPKLRWGAFPPEDSSAARARLLDAAESCFARYGVVKTTVEDVAGHARVSRATVYRYFDGRDELILGVLMREANRFLDRLGDRIAAQASLADAVVEGVVYTVKAVRDDPHLALLFAPEAAGETMTIAGASAALFGRTAEFLRPLLSAAQSGGQLRPGVDLDEASEWLLRTILSLLTVSGPVARTAADQRRYLRTFLVPALVADPPPAESSRRRASGAARCRSPRLAS
jgi:AcrR family transcriptional regulator